MQCAMLLHCMWSDPKLDQTDACMLTWRNVDEKRSSRPSWVVCLSTLPTDLDSSCEQTGESGGQGGRGELWLGAWRDEQAVDRVIGV